MDPTSAGDHGVVLGDELPEPGDEVAAVVLGVGERVVAADEQAGGAEGVVLEEGVGDGLGVPTSGLSCPGRPTPPPGGVKTAVVDVTAPAAAASSRCEPTLSTWRARRWAKVGLAATASWMWWARAHASPSVRPRTSAASRR